MRKQPFFSNYAVKICLRAIWAVIICLLIGSGCENPSGAPEIEEGLWDINGTKLFVKTIGEGEPILVLHGGPGMDHSYFLPHLEGLAENHQLVFFDQRACGKSETVVDTSSMRMDQFVEDIEALRVKLGAGRFHLMGHSWGGLLGMWYATKYPEHLASCILVNSVGASVNQTFSMEAQQTIAERQTDKAFAKRQELIKSAGFAQGDSATMVALYQLSFAPQFFNRIYLDSLALYIPPDFQPRQQKLMFLYPDLRSYDLHPKLHVISCPVLIIHGDYDATPLAAIEKIKVAIPQAKLTVIPDAGHFSFIEQKERFEKIVKDFLN